MKQYLFNSLDMSNVAKWIWDNWDEDLHGERPEAYWAHEVINMAVESNNASYLWTVDTFNRRYPDSEVLLIGHLGLWNGDRFAFKTVKTADAFEWRFDDMGIYYEDGNIWIEEHHHDGTNYLRVLGLKNWESLNLEHLSDAEYEDRYEFIQSLHYGCAMPEEFVEKNLPLVTYSIAPYLWDVVSKEVVEDMKKYGLEIPVNIK